MENAKLFRGYFKTFYIDLMGNLNLCIPLECGGVFQFATNLQQSPQARYKGHAASLQKIAEHITNGAGYGQHDQGCQNIKQENCHAITPPFSLWGGDTTAPRRRPSKGRQA